MCMRFPGSIKRVRSAIGSGRRFLLAAVLSTSMLLPLTARAEDPTPAEGTFTNVALAKRFGFDPSSTQGTSATRIQELESRLVSGRAVLADLLELQRLLLGSQLSPPARSMKASEASETTASSYNRLFPASDFDGDGKKDLINFAYPYSSDGSQVTIEARRGTDASLIWSVPTAYTNETTWNHDLDLTGDSINDLLKVTSSERTTSRNTLVAGRTTTHIDLEFVVYGGSDGAIAWSKVIHQRVETKYRSNLLTNDQRYIDSYEDLVVGVEEIGSTYASGSGGAIITTTNGKRVRRWSGGSYSDTNAASSTAHVLAGEDGHETALVNGPQTDGWAPTFMGWPDVDGDGVAEIMQVRRWNQRIDGLALRHLDGSELWASEVDGVIFWIAPAALRSSAPVDVLLTGWFNMSYQTYYQAEALSASDGSVLWSGATDHPAALIDDSDGDGGREVVDAFRFDGGVAVRARDGATGQTKWLRTLDNSSEYGYTFIDCDCSVGDLNGDGISDQVAYYKSYDENDQFADGHAEAISGANGKTIWTTSHVSDPSDLPVVLLDFDVWDWDWSPPLRTCHTNDNATKDLVVIKSVPDPSGSWQFNVQLLEGSDLSPVWSAEGLSATNDGPYAFGSDLSGSSSCELLLLDEHTSAYSAQGKLWDF